ncbi:MAG: type II toxin-antitoxin system RelE/ParE family toxin [Burkholderiales bacterium]
MRFEVRLTADAVRDLEEIDDWIAAHDSPAKAEHVSARIEAAIAALARFPQRGRHPGELLALGIREYRETFFKPYRILYYVEGARVYVTLVADGRRDLQALLERRLLGS